MIIRRKLLFFISFVISFQQTLLGTLLQLKSLGLQKVKTAFDMDYVSNYHVQTGYLNLYALLDDLELSYSTFLWDPRYKGLDDYIWEYLLRKRRET